MNIILCSYPLFLTYQRLLPSLSQESDYSPIDKENLEFLLTWWSSFSSLTLLEQYAGIDNLPLYSLSKSGLLLFMYSSTYRKWFTHNVLYGAAAATEKGKNITLSIIDEHFPIAKQYIDLYHREHKKDEDESSSPSYVSNVIYSIS